MFHTNHEIPVVRRHVDHPCTVHRHAGVVASDVKLAEIAFGFRQGIDDGSLLCHIDPDGHDTLVGAGEAVGRLFDCVLLNVRHNDIGACFSERGRDAEANAGSGTGHDGCLTRDVHV
jgi:hypothetical protein